jgi:hypothetical protein
MLTFCQFQQGWYSRVRSVKASTRAAVIIEMIEVWCLSMEKRVTVSWVFIYLFYTITGHVYSSQQKSSVFRQTRVNTCVFTARKLPIQLFSDGLILCFFCSNNSIRHLTSFAVLAVWSMCAWKSCYCTTNRIEWITCCFFVIVFGHILPSASMNVSGWQYEHGFSRCLCNFIISREILQAWCYRFFGGKWHALQSMFRCAQWE